MQRRFSTHKFWFTALGIIILAAGLAAAYALKTRAYDDAAQYRIVDGQTYSELRGDTKQDADELRKYGGTPGLIIAAYRRKFQHLFQGDDFSFLIVVVAILLAAGCFRFAWKSENA